VIKVLDNKLGNDVHMLWALSKDFGSSGFRFGVLYSQNDALLRALGNINVFSGVSNPMQMIASKFLKDDDFVDNFLQLSKDKLSASYAIVTRGLDDMGVPYVPAPAGIFVYCDFSSLLSDTSSEAEAKFSELVQNVGRIVMTPGMSW